MTRIPINAGKLGHIAPFHTLSSQNVTCQNAPGSSVTCYIAGHILVDNLRATHTCAVKQVQQSG